MLWGWKSVGTDEAQLGVGVGLGMNAHDRFVDVRCGLQLLEFLEELGRWFSCDPVKRATLAVGAMALEAVAREDLPRMQVERQGGGIRAGRRADGRGGAV